MLDPLAGTDVFHPPSFDETTRLAATLTNTPMAAISLLGETCQWFKAEVGLNVDSTPIEQAFCKYTAASREVLVVPDARLDDRFVENPLVTSGKIRSYLGAPLILPDGTAIGALCVLDTEPRDFGEREVELLQVLATHVVGQLQLEALIDRQAQTIADLENVRRELSYQARHDWLTRLLNRRGLESELDRLIDEAFVSSDQSPHSFASLIFVDLDGFKAINDQHGHQVGDRVLLEIAKRLTFASPGDAVIARFGGDEFVVARVHDEGDDPSDSCLESLVRAVAEPMIIDGIRIGLTASAGLACEPVQSLRAAALIDSADRAMYLAKRHGGDRATAARGNILGRDGLPNGQMQRPSEPLVDLSLGDVVRRRRLKRLRDQTTALDLPMAGM